MVKTSIFDFFKKKDKQQGLTYAPTQNGMPFYSSFGDSVYASDIVVQSIRCKANEFKKLDPRHIKTTDGITSTVTDSSIARVLKRPNELMTTCDFLEKITILLELNKNVFIYPTSYMTRGGEKVFTGLYPLKPCEVGYMTNDKGEMFLKMRFLNGNEVTMPASDVIHWKKDYGVNDYFGGCAFGGNDNAGLLAMLERYDQLTQSIAKALEVSCSVNAVVKYNSYTDTDALKAQREKFVVDLQHNKSGILFMDMTSDITKLPRDVKLVDAETLKFFYEAIGRANGTSLPILNGTYTKAEKEAYYEHALEADIKSLGQAISRVVFSDRATGHGNEIVLYPNEIQFMSMENKISFAQIAMPAGTLMKDEFRALFGYAPLPEGQGQVIAQGYNNLLDENNNNTLGGGNNEE